MRKRKGPLHVTVVVVRGHAEDVTSHGVTIGNEGVPFILSFFLAFQVG